MAKFLTTRRRAPAFSLLALCLLFTACRKDQYDLGVAEEKGPPTTAELFHSVIEGLPENATLEAFDTALSAAIPVERFATNAYQPPLATTDPSDLRLPTKTALRVGMPWFVNGEMAPFFVAMAKGYYDAVNLEVELVPGGPGIDHSLTLLAGTVDLALIADPFRLFSMITSETGVPIRTIGGLYPSLPTAFIGLDPNTPKNQRSTNSPTLEEFSGSYIGILPGYDDYLRYLNFKYAGEYSFDRSMRIGGSVSPVMLGKIDWAMGWISFQAREMEREGFQNWWAIFYRDIALDVPADIFIAKEGDLERRADVIRAFMWATAKGKADQIADYAEAAAITNRLQPSENVVSDAYLIRRFELEAPTFNPEPGNDPLYMDLEKWRTAFSALAQAGVLE